MKAQTIDIQQSTGRILSSAIFRPGGKKLLAKGHILREEDIRILRSEGMDHIWVAELDEDEVPEEQAVCAIAGEMACGCYEKPRSPPKWSGFARLPSGASRKAPALRSRCVSQRR